MPKFTIHIQYSLTILLHLLHATHLYYKKESIGSSHFTSIIKSCYTQFVADTTSVTHTTDTHSVTTHTIHIQTLKTSTYYRLIAYLIPYYYRLSRSKRLGNQSSKSPSTPQPLASTQYANTQILYTRKGKPLQNGD